MNTLQDRIASWAAVTFSDQTDMRIVAHLDEELTELHATIDRMRESDGLGSDLWREDMEEAIADCVILLACLASRHGIRVTEAVETKHVVNTQRRFAFDPERGYDKRVVGAFQPPAPGGKE